MLTFFSKNNECKSKKSKKSHPLLEKSKELFLHGKFPVVTTTMIKGKKISKVLGLVCCRAYDSEEAFFGMTSRALSKGAHALIGYLENVAFHPDGSKYYSCYGTAIMFAWEEDERYGAAIMGRKGLEVLNNNKKGIEQTSVHTQISVTKTDTIGKAASNDV